MRVHHHHGSVHDNIMYAMPVCKIRNNNMIKEIKLCEKTILVSQYADDTTFFS